MSNGTKAEEVSPQEPWRPAEWWVAYNAAASKITCCALIDIETPVARLERLCHYVYTLLRYMCCARVPLNSDRRCRERERAQSSSGAFVVLFARQCASIAPSSSSHMFYPLCLCIYIYICNEMVQLSSSSINLQQFKWTTICMKPSKYMHSNIHNAQVILSPIRKAIHVCCTVQSNWTLKWMLW